MNNKRLRVYKEATAIITGGASGIGRALAEELVERGSEVVLADIQIEHADEVASSIRSRGGKATATKVDVTDFSAVEQVVQETYKRTGRLDYMFNNAETAIIGPIKRHSIEDWDHVINVNLKGIVNGIHSSYQIMLEQGFGHIVNTSSIFGLIPQAGSPAYTTTKHAIVGISNCLRAEAMTEGIQVSVLCPGAIRTPILERGGTSVKWLTEKQFDKTDIERRSKEAQKYMDPTLFASKALDAIAKNKAIIIEPSSYKPLWWGFRISHSFGISFARKVYKDRFSRFFD